jgi:hypothetical protein
MKKWIRIVPAARIRAPEFFEIIVWQNPTLKLKSANK